MCCFWPLNIVSSALYLWSLGGDIFPGVSNDAVLCGDATLSDKLVINVLVYKRARSRTAVLAVVIVDGHVCPQNSVIN